METDSDNNSAETSKSNTAGQGAEETSSGSTGGNTTATMTQPTTRVGWKPSKIGVVLFLLGLFIVYNSTKGFKEFEKANPQRNFLSQESPEESLNKELARQRAVEDRNTATKPGTVLMALGVLLQFGWQRKMLKEMITPKS